MTQQFYFFQPVSPLYMPIPKTFPRQFFLMYPVRISKFTKETIKIIMYRTLAYDGLTINQK